MRVDRLALKDFTVFGETEFEFSLGLNVFIGANGTGKSHVLKTLYSLTKSLSVTEPSERENGKNIPAILEPTVLHNFSKTLRPEAITSLVRHAARQGNLAVHGDFGTVEIQMSNVASWTFKWRDYRLPEGIAVFMPTNEVLSMYPGFVAAYERRELSFDKTVRDLCVDLSANPLRIDLSPALAEVAARLDVAVGGKTVLRGDRFYVALADDWLLEAPMLAEGLRKLASLAHLIRNGSLLEGSVLFWDEPETNLNPKLIPVVASALMAIAGAGVQVFIATHDFLLTNELSLVAEYETPEGKAAKPRFFCLGRSEPREPVTVQWGDTVADLGSNPILEEFAAHYDRERELFYGQQQPLGAEGKQ